MDGLPKEEMNALLGPHEEPCVSIYLPTHRTAHEARQDPNHYLSVAVWYLFRNRPGWRKDAAIGKTFVTSSMIDRVAKHLGRKRFEVPVGFKWTEPWSLAEKAPRRRENSGWVLWF